MNTNVHIKSIYLKATLHFTRIRRVLQGSITGHLQTIFDMFVELKAASSCTYFVFNVA